PSAFGIWLAYRKIIIHLQVLRKARKAAPFSQISTGISTPDRLHVEARSAARIKPEAEMWVSAARGCEAPQKGWCSNSVLRMRAEPLRSVFPRSPYGAPLAEQPLPQLRK